jgi:hypothetical protein
MCGEASHRSYEDRRLAWSLLATSGFEVRLVPGNHHTMIEEPHAQVLARELRKYLDRIQEPRSPTLFKADREQMHKQKEGRYERRFGALVS